MSARGGIGEAAVDGKGRPGRRRRALEEEEDGPAYVPGGDGCFEQIALLVIGLESSGIEAAGLHSVGADLGPQARRLCSM